MNDPRPIIAATLRQVAGWGHAIVLQGYDHGDLDTVELDTIALRVLRTDNDDCTCPMCEEVVCDTTCPLAEWRGQWS